MLTMTFVVFRWKQSAGKDNGEVPKGESHRGDDGKLYNLQALWCIFLVKLGLSCLLSSWL